MRFSSAAAVFVAAVSRATAASDDAAEDMGPAAFMWPQDRVWNAAADNTAPCGSVARAGSRTQFPLTNGRLALVAQDESAAIHIGVSYHDDPTSLDDFDIFTDPSELADLDPGHTCVTVPDAPSNITAGSNATFTLFYMLPDSGEVYYACADIEYVETSAFTTAIPCFNATTEDPDVQVDSDVNSSVADSAAADDYHSESDLEAWGADGDKSSGLSPGAKAGVAVGAVAGAAVLAVVGVLMWRRRKAGKAAAVAPAMTQKQWDVEHGSDSASQRS
ncbi:hypothetical protein TD95_003829 [Thielaviopsis punctulata]|uniref:Copper acquisition factor BIM1-like domain-containing protein n=1 Tax=Thielaviopsis punctulata TaxID=72032 RepID=A0A0F4ZHI4_9PEZI|nr:hypothetical protein TD95_003829 [Thielaviopsis punctulata]